MSETINGRVPTAPGWSASPEPPGLCPSGDHPSRAAAYFPKDLRGADRLGWIAGYYGPKLPPGVAQELINLAYEWSETRP